MSNNIEALPVERDHYGYWTHPVYDAFCDGREYVPTEEFNAWMKKSGLEWYVEYRDEDDIDPSVDGYDISAWQPEPPVKDDGWFVGSIHDSEDGALCIWLRRKPGPAMTNTAEVKPLSEEQERRNFEAWFLTFRPEWSPDDFTMTNYISGKCYGNGYLRAVWKGWEARAKQGASHE